MRITRVIFKYLNVEIESFNLLEFTLIRFRIKVNNGIY